MIRKNLIDINTLIFFIIGFISCFYYQLVGLLNISILPYILILFFLIINIKIVQFSLFQIISITLVALFLLIVLSYNPNYIEIFKNFRYWFGIIFFLAYFRNYNISQNFYRYIFIFLCSQILIELILVNLFVEVKDYLQYAWSTEFFGFYNRPVGFAGSPSASITIICSFYCFLKFNLKYHLNIYEYILFILTVVLTMSYAGYIIFLFIIIFEFYKSKKTNSKIYITAVLFIILILFLQQMSPDIRSPVEHFMGVFKLKYVTVKIFILEFIAAWEHSQEIYIYKLHSNLFSFDNLNQFLVSDLEGAVLEFKEIPVKDFYTQEPIFTSDINKFHVANKRTVAENLFGIQIYWPINTVGGDFGIISFFEMMGLIGVIIYILIILSFANDLKSLAFLILIVGSFHYPSIMSICGQFILALVISNKKIYN